MSAWSLLRRQIGSALAHEPQHYAAPAGEGNTDRKSTGAEALATIRPGHVKCQGCGTTRGSAASFEAFRCEAA